jgi:tryptophan synthase alpha chain
VADAVVIGSRLIEEIEAAGPDHAVQKVRDFVSGIRRALDEAELPLLESL